MGNDSKGSSSPSKASLVYGFSLAYVFLDAPMSLFHANGTPCSFINVDNKMLAFSGNLSQPRESYLNLNRIVFDHDVSSSTSRRTVVRRIPQQSEVNLDAPDHR